MAILDWYKAREDVIGKDHPAKTDTINRALRTLLLLCGLNPDATFPGLAPVFNVIAYGAAGDGSSNSAAAILAASNDAVLVGGVVLVPQGKTVRTDTPFNLPDGVKLQLDGILKAGAAMQSVVLGPPASHINNGRIKGNGVIDCNGLATNGVSIPYARDLTLRDFIVWRPAGSGVIVGNFADRANCGYGARVSNVTVKNVTDLGTDSYRALTVGAAGIEVYTSDSKVHNDRFTGFEIGVLNYGSNSTILDVHAWSPRSGGTPGDGTGGTMKKGIEDHSNGTHISHFYADTPIQYGLHLYGGNYKLSSNRIYNGIFGGTIGTLVCVRFETAAPFSDISDTQYLNSGALTILKDIEVNGGDMSSLNIINQQWSGTVVTVTQNKIRSATVSSLRVGASANASLNNIQEYALTLTPVAVNANSTSEQAFACPGVINSDRHIFMSPPGLPSGIGVVSVRFWNTDQVAIKFINCTGGALTPTAGTYRVLVIRTA